MMKAKNSTRKTQILRAIVKGIAAFGFSGLVVQLVFFRLNNYILLTLLGGGAGCFLLALFFNQSKKTKIRITLIGAFAYLVAMALSFLIVEGIGSLIPTIGNALDPTGLPDIIAIMLMSVIFSSLVAFLVFDKSFVALFALPGALFAIPAGILVVFFNISYNTGGWMMDWYKSLPYIDLNFMTITMGIGAGMGFSMMRKENHI